MPLDFRTYTDPGVYIETITPPVVFLASIEPTILAIVGSAPSARDVFESTNFITGEWVAMPTKGGDPSTPKVKDRLLGTQYVSAAIGTLQAGISAGATAFAIDLFDADWIEPSGTTFVAQFEDEKVTITTGSTSISNGVYTLTGVARAASATVAAQHGIGQVLNQTEDYDTTPGIEVARLTTPISSTQGSFDADELYGVQVIDTSTATGYGAGDSFKLTYAGQETIAFVHGANATATDLQNGLIGLSTIAAAGVTVTGSTNTGPFTVKFFDPNTDVTALTVTTPVGYTGAFTVSNRGIVANTYLDIEGERMIVTAVAGSAPQTVTVDRGVAGTYALTHGASILAEESGADYLVKIGAGDDGTNQTADDTLEFYILGRIGNGAYVNVAYEATDAAQFSASLYDDLDAVREKYGDPLDSNGQVNSELTLGAQLAFANGATQLVLIAADTGDADPIQAAIDKLEFEQSVNSIAVLSGDATDVSYIRGHVVTMSEQGLLRRAFVGLDGLATPAPTSADFRTKAGQLNSERVSLVGPAQFQLDNGTGTPIILPGYFAAAAVAGIQAGLTPQEPLTRKQVFGFVGISDQDTSHNIFLMQAAGVLVVFQDRLDRLIIKHGLTTDMTSVYSREISVVTARDRLRDFILETLEGGDLIGSPMSAETPNLVMSAVNSALEEATRQGLIFDYSDVKFRFPTENPTLIQVRFSYKPTLPLNYIHVQFSIDTNTGTVDFQNINDNTSQ